MFFIGAATLANDTPKTMLELIQTAIAARTYDTAQQETDAVNRVGGIFGEVFLEATDNIYTMDRYKVTHVGADFTGGGAVLAGGVNRRVGNGADLGQRMVYQNSGADVTLYFDITGN